MDRGTLATVALVVVIVVSVGSLGLPLALTYGIAHSPDEVQPLTRWALRIFVVQAIALAPVAAFGIALLARRDDIRTTILLGAAVAPAILGQMYALAILQGRQQFALMNLARTAPPALYALSVTLLLFSENGSLDAVTAAYLMANAVAAAGLLLFVGRATGPTSSIDGRRLFSFGIRAWLGSVSPMDTLRFDQIVVVLVFAPTIVGTYVVALAFSNLPRLIGASIGLVAYPRLAAMGTGQEFRPAVFRYTAATLLTAAPFVGLVVAAADPLTEIFFGSQYAASADLVGLLVTAGWLAGGRRTMVEATRGAGLAAAGSIAEIAAWVGFLGAVALLVPALGERGVAIAMLIGSAVGLGALTAFVVRRQGPVSHVDKAEESTKAS
jgi:O-antigen/teichoic acid export membrane protein